MTKEQLKQYVAIDRELIHLDETITRLRARLEAPGIQVLSIMPKARAPGADAVSENIAKLVELEHLYNERWDALIDLQTDIENAIDTLPSIERMVVRKRYIDGRSWERIADEVPCGWGTVHRIHNSALERLGRIEKENELPKKMVHNGTHGYAIL